MGVGTLIADGLCSKGLLMYQQGYIMQAQKRDQNLIVSAQSRMKQVIGQTAVPAP